MYLKSHIRGFLPKVIFVFFCSFQIVSGQIANAAEPNKGVEKYDQFYQCVTDCVFAKLDQYKESMYERWLELIGDGVQPSDKEEMSEMFSRLPEKIEQFTNECVDTCSK